MEALQVALAQAVMQAVPEETRKEIFAKALHEYLFKLDNKYNQNESPITRAFSMALDEAVRKLADEVVQENRALLVPMMKEAFDKAIASPATLQNFIDRMSHALRYR